LLCYSGVIAWIAAFALRGRDPDLPMERDTTTRAARFSSPTATTANWPPHRCSTKSWEMRSRLEEWEGYTRACIEQSRKN